jgi:hypothetical protein
MVVKNTQAVAKATAPRLPPLHKLRVRKPDQAGANPCIGVMSSVLGITLFRLHLVAPALTRSTGCWASSGYTAQGCAALEQQLRACMDAPVCFGRPISTHDLSDSSPLAESRTNKEEFHQLPSLEIISPNHRSAQAQLVLGSRFLTFTTASWHYTASRRQEYSLLIFASLSRRRPALVSLLQLYLRHVQNFSIRSCQPGPFLHKLYLSIPMLAQSNMLGASSKASWLRALYRVHIQRNLYVNGLLDKARIL